MFFICLKLCNLIIISAYNITCDQIERAAYIEISFGITSITDSFGINFRCRASFSRATEQSWWRWSKFKVRTLRTPDSSRRSRQRAREDEDASSGSGSNSSSSSSSNFLTFSTFSITNAIKSVHNARIASLDLWMQNWRFWSSAARLICFQHSRSYYTSFQFER